MIYFQATSIATTHPEEEIQVASGDKDFYCLSEFIDNFTKPPPIHDMSAADCTRYFSGNTDKSMVRKK